MRPKELVKKAQRLREEATLRKRDQRYLRVIGFLKAKGLLFDENILPKANVKLDIKDVLWVGEKVEPRVLEVFPAAFLHFPKTFFNTKAIPRELVEIIAAIRNKVDLDQTFRGIEFKKMNHWANLKLKDQRTKPIAEHKIPRNYRFKPQVVAMLANRALAENISETELIEKLILDG